MFGNVNWYFLLTLLAKYRNNWTIFLAGDGENTSVLIILATTVQFLHFFIVTVYKQFTLIFGQRLLWSCTYIHLNNDHVLSFLHL